MLLYSYHLECINLFSKTRGTWLIDFKIPGGWHTRGGFRSDFHLHFNYKWRLISSVHFLLLLLYFRIDQITWKWFQSQVSWFLCGACVWVRCAFAWKQWIAFCAENVHRIIIIIIIISQIKYVWFGFSL